MLHNLPQQYRMDPWVVALTESICGRMSVIDADAASITEQLSLDQVSWNLPVEERVAGIVPAQAASIDERRSALKAKWRSGGKVSLSTLQDVAASWNKGKVDVAFTGGHIVVSFADTIGIPDDLAGLKAAIRAFAPAHLQIDYIIKYNTWGDLAGMTWSQISAKTWAEAKERDLT